MEDHWGLKVKQLREDRHWFQEDVADKSGLSRGMIGRIETGSIISCTPDTLDALSRAFDIPKGDLARYVFGGEKESSKISTTDLIAELQQRAELSSQSETIVVPVVGYIAAGIPISAEQMDLGKIVVSKLDLSGALKMSGIFGLIVSGDSLIGDDIQDKDTVIVDPDPVIIDGRIYIVKLGNEYVARHLHRENGFVILTSSNGKYDKMKVKEVEIKGRVVLSGKWKKH